MDSFNADLISAFLGQITHLITTESEVKASTYKIEKAVQHNAVLVTEKWLLESIRMKKRLDEAPFAIGQESTPEVRNSHLLPPFIECTHLQMHIRSPKNRSCFRSQIDVLLLPSTA